jgi:hypothetical protein
MSSEFYLCNTDLSSKVNFDYDPAVFSIEPEPDIDVIQWTSCRYHTDGGVLTSRRKQAVAVGYQANTTEMMLSGVSTITTFDLILSKAQAGGDYYFYHYYREPSPKTYKVAITSISPLRAPEEGIKTLLQYSMTLTVKAEV